jgi:cytidine deaminase
MTEGDSLRHRAASANIVGLLGLLKLRGIRESISGNKNTPDKLRRIAYVIRSFKRTEEVELFRDIYGKAFTLISVYASQSDRTNNLKRRCQGRRKEGDLRTAEELAVHLINRDYREEDERFGQRVGDTFPLADYFVTSDPRARLDEQLKRLVRSDVW